MMTHVDAVLSPKMRPRSARSLMLSRGTIPGASVPLAVAESDFALEVAFAVAFRNREQSFLIGKLFRGPRSTQPLE